MKKLLLIVMSIFMINSQMRSNSTGIQEGLIGATAYIATSILVSAMINSIKPNTETTPFTPKTFISSVCSATAGMMAYQGKSIEACYCLICALATALGTVVFNTAQSTENLVYPNFKKNNN